MHYALRRLLAATSVFACAAAGASAQLPTSFSIAGDGATISAPSTFTGVAITAGDILTAATVPPPPGGVNSPGNGILPAPAVLISAGLGPPAPGLGLTTHAGCVGVPPGGLCPVEVDALAYGSDFPIPTHATAPSTYQFSVDRWAAGMPGTPPLFAAIGGEGSLGITEAAADIFGDVGIPLAPVPPFGPALLGARKLVDGNGVGPPPFMVPFPFALGLLEPSPPVPGPGAGDDLDAVDVNVLFWNYPIYYSLDSAFPNPATGIPNSGTALAHGVSGADVLLTPAAGAGPVIYAPAPLLGLDLMGFDTDDLDALALMENGTGAFEPAPQPFSWAGGATDMLLFSVRAGSAVVGMPDSLFGLPIEPGDILSTPVAGGVSPFPSIFVAAETLDLWTVRSFGPHPVTGLAIGDDLDALDVVNQGTLNDCNNNGVHDPFDILVGNSTDNNGNGTPDECETVGTNYCGPANLNSSGQPAIIAANGVALPQGPLLLGASQMPTNQFGYFLASQATGTATPPGSQGILCLGGSIARFNLQVQNSGTSGAFSIQVNTANMPSNPPAPIQAGQTWHFQCWFRDQNPGVTSNFTDGITVQF
ncbi:MAG: hypothetical protein GY711_01570 [bacterium]|nr:hypothetical protein [bacterium]